MPTASVGAIPSRRLFTRSRSTTSLRSSINVRRIAEDGSITQLKSPVARTRSAEPPDRLNAARGVSRGRLLTELMTPAVEPRPNSIEDGPSSTATAS